MAGPQDMNQFATLDQQSPYGAKPQQVDQPEPGEQDQIDFMEGLEAPASPKMQAPE